MNNDNLGGNVHPTSKVAGSTSHQFTDSDKAVSPPKKRTGETLKSAPSIANSDTTEQVHHYKIVSLSSS